MSLNVFQWQKIYHYFIEPLFIGTLYSGREYPIFAMRVEGPEGRKIFWSELVRVVLAFYGNYSIAALSNNKVQFTACLVSPVKNPFFSEYNLQCIKNKMLP